MKKFTPSACAACCAACCAAWVLGSLAFGSLYARGKYDKGCTASEGVYYENPAYDCPPLLPAWDEGGRPNPPSFKVEKVMALDTPPPLPAAPEFKGLENQGFSLSNAAFDEQGSVLELWFRKQGVSEKDIKALNQLPADQKTLIRKIVQAYQIDMQRTALEMRPNYQRIRNDMDALKLDLSRLILIAEGADAQGKEVKAVLDELSAKEAELTNLLAIENKITAVFRSEMTDQIASVVNAWISAQASKTKESLSSLFQDAEDTYGLKWE